MIPPCNTEVFVKDLRGETGPKHSPHISKVARAAMRDPSPHIENLRIHPRTNISVMPETCLSRDDQSLLPSPLPPSSYV
jgi:hypothetical protein